MKRFIWILAALAVPILATAAPRAPRQVDWTRLNPAYEGATFVRDTTVCAGCHEESVTTYQHTVHSRIFSTNPRTELDKLDCESCHGPRSKHVESPDDSLALRGMKPEQRSAICLQCHEGGKNQQHWQSSAHVAGGVSCDSCHVVMERRSETALLATADQSAMCSSCHASVRGQMNKMSHHPVREGKMECSSCHNPHGSTGPAMLRRATVSETCTSCHDDKRGPFLWEHPPARDNCSTCHNAHGSNNQNLLVAKGGLLCFQCHSYGGHINVPRYNRTSTVAAQGCANCHMAVHGSNHPSGAKLTR